jgi:aminoglycoside 3-N-acetyltransferase
MPDSPLIAPERLPLTVGLMVRGFSAVGLTAGMDVIVHTRLSALGWIAGGAQALIEALQRVITPAGTIMMPAHNGDNSDPSHWQNPPVPEAWWQIIRDNLPAYDPRRTPTWGIGVVPELFRTHPGVLRSDNPHVSFAAWGAQAAYLTADHLLENDLGEGSPLAKLYDLDGHILLIGVGHDTNTALHLAEHRAQWASKTEFDDGCAMRVNGRREWVAFRHLALDSDDFPALGADFERDHPEHVRIGQVGKAEVRLIRQRPLIDYAVGWIERHRT